MPKHLSMSPIDGETNDDFADRVAEQAAKHFGESAPLKDYPITAPTDTVEPA